jgi:Tol biopolymer transport system component
MQRLRLSLLLIGFSLVVLTIAVAAPAASQVRNGGILLRNIYNGPDLSGPPVHLWLTPPSLRGPARDLGEVTPTQDTFGGATFSADGSKVIVTRYENARSPVVVVSSIDLQSGTRRLLFRNFYDGAGAVTPAPNGRLLAYAARPALQGEDRIYVRDLSTHAVRTFPLTPGAPTAFSWSPDSRTLYYAASGCPGSRGNGLCALTLASGQESIVPLAFQNIQGSAVFSPDGRRVAWWDLKGPSGERIANAKTGKVVRNLVGEGFDPPIWSPNGNKLIVGEVLKAGGDQNGLDIFDFSTHSLQRIPFNPPADAQLTLTWQPLAWQPLGR